MNPNEQFKETPSRLIADQKNDLLWAPKDSYQNLGKWINWDEITPYIRLINQVYLGGFSDWRLPTKDEAMTLYDPSFSNKDWEGEVVHIHPVFESKCSFYMWTGEVSEAGKALCLDLRDGAVDYVEKSERERLATRLVRTLK